MNVYKLFKVFFNFLIFYRPSVGGSMQLRHVLLDVTYQALKSWNICLFVYMFRDSLSFMAGIALKFGHNIHILEYLENNFLILALASLKAAQVSSINTLILYKFVWRHSVKLNITKTKSSVWDEVFDRPWIMRSDISWSIFWENGRLQKKNQ